MGKEEEKTVSGEIFKQKTSLEVREVFCNVQTVYVSVKHRQVHMVTKKYLSGTFTFCPP